MARTRSFRLPDDLLASLQDRSEERGESANALAERYLEEGLRRDTHPLIVFREGAAGRRAALAGTRLDVAQVIDTLQAEENSIEATAEYFDVSEQHVRAALRYYADYREEIDKWRERMQTIAEREEEAWRREQAILA
jgi:uncharacterized protein (DUF433 family)